MCLDLAKGRKISIIVWNSYFPWSLDCTHLQKKNIQSPVNPYCNPNGTLLQSRLVGLCVLTKEKYAFTMKVTQELNTEFHSGFDGFFNGTKNCVNWGRWVFELGNDIPKDREKCKAFNQWKNACLFDLDIVPHQLGRYKTLVNWP
jgi:hypothetical protein